MLPTRIRHGRAPQPMVLRARTRAASVVSVGRPSSRSHPCRGRSAADRRQIGPDREACGGHGWRRREGRKYWYRGQACAVRLVTPAHAAPPPAAAAATAPASIKVASYSAIGVPPPSAATHARRT